MYVNAIANGVVHLFQGNPQDLEDVQKFIVQMYDVVRPPSKGDNYLHVPTDELCSYSMTATDEMSVRTVFPKVQDTILTKHLQPPNHV